MGLIYYENGFDDLIKDIAVVDFYATWCGPCKMFSPVFEEVSSEMDINFIKINVDENTDIIPEETNASEITDEQALDESENNADQDTNDSISEETKVVNETSDTEEVVSEETNESEIIDEQIVDESENNMEQNDNNTVPEETSDAEIGKICNTDNKKPYFSDTSLPLR